MSIKVSLKATVILAVLACAGLAGFVPRRMPPVPRNRPSARMPAPP